MSALAVVLALVGAVALLFAIVALARKKQKPVSAPPLVEPDLAAPYREGLYAAIRLQRAAQDFEHQLYVEAVQHKRHEP